MASYKLRDKIFFRLRNECAQFWASVNTIWWRLNGATIGMQTRLYKVFVTWPHQISVGQNCTIEHHVFFKYDGIWKPGPSIIIKDRVFIGANCEFNIKKGIEISNDCLIGSNCKFVDHDHGIDINQKMNAQQCPEAEIIIEDDVWLGANVVVLKGVRIGKGSIVGAGTILTKSVPSYEIWAGVPGKKIGERK